MITGLEMASSYFTEWGYPFLVQHFPSISERVAAGIWRGSQIFGADDELSRDHGWGAMFTLVLTEADFNRRQNAWNKPCKRTLRRHGRASLRHRMRKSLSHRSTSSFKIMLVSASLPMIPRNGSKVFTSALEQEKPNST